MAFKLLRARVRALRLLRGKPQKLPPRSPELFAGMATSLYLSIVVIAVGWRATEFINLPLNELGDFLAGVFGPLAIFWVVLGYYQQGKELKVSSQALLAQCIELANSAEQQRLALEISKSQMVLAQEKHQVEMLELEESIRPRVSLAHVSSGRTPNSDYHNFEIFVFNAAAYYLNVLWHHENVEFTALTAGYIGIKAKEKYQITFDRLQSPADIEMVVYCKNVRGRSYGYRFTFKPASGEMIPHLPSPTIIQEQ